MTKTEVTEITISYYKYNCPFCGCLNEHLCFETENTLSCWKCKQHIIKNKKTSDWETLQKTK